jgi:capsule polysaccharide export protein KpsE/RkpR
MNFNLTVCRHLAWHALHQMYYAIIPYQMICSVTHYAMCVCRRHWSRSQAHTRSPSAPSIQTRNALVLLVNHRHPTTGNMKYSQHSCMQSADLVCALQQSVCNAAI